MSLRNIIFDLGGVIINVNYHKTSEAFQKLGIKNFDEIYSKAKQSTLFDDLEKGLIENVEFENRLKEFLPSASNEDLINAWNAMLMNIPEERIEFLTELKQKYRIFLLSNTNRIHVSAFMKSMMEVYNRNIFEEIFEKYYFSCEIGMRKPDPEVFEYVLSENQLSARETLFIDDSPQHIEGALQAGLMAEWLDIESGEEIHIKYNHLL